jgi:hypothetical protein
VFGGSNAKNFCNSDMYVYELDDFNAKIFIKEDKNAEQARARKEQAMLKRGMDIQETLTPLDALTKYPR